MSNDDIEMKYFEPIEVGIKEIKLGKQDLRTKSKKWVFSFAAVSAFAAACTWSTDAISKGDSDSSSKRPSLALPEASSGSPLDPTKLSEPLPANLFVELAKLLNPAVVSIFSSTLPRSAPGGYRDPMQDFFDQFFGPGFSPYGDGGGSQPRASGLGTGFIVREDGLIITNNHVVERADIIKVQLDNDEDHFFEAEVLGRDARTDVALLKIEAKKKLPIAQLGSSKSVQVGEWVAAFGNPYGHAHTMTKGIISAIGRAIPELNRFPFLQTDASINPGNSGGPLVNAKGLVIGVNTAIDGRAQGIGFAIPIDDVKRIVEQLEKDGRIKRGFIGLGLAPVSGEVARALGLEDAKGAIVAQVVQGGPADKAGIREYDIITEFNGKKIANPQELTVAVRDSDVGTSVKVKALRYAEKTNRKSTLTFDVKLTENPEDLATGQRQQTRSRGNSKAEGRSAPKDLGFTVSDLTTKLRKTYRIPPDVNGPVITQVEARSPAARVGLQPGDVILDIDRTAVKSAADVAARLEASSGRSMLRIARGAMRVLIVL